MYHLSSDRRSTFAGPSLALEITAPSFFSTPAIMIYPGDNDGYVSMYSYAQSKSLQLVMTSRMPHERSFPPWKTSSACPIQFSNDILFSDLALNEIEKAFGLIPVLTPNRPVSMTASNRYSSPL